MSRAADDLVLAMIRWRCAGQSSAEIAARTGLTQEYVRTATNRVRDADAAESGEDVAAAYWDQSSGLKAGAA